MHRSLAKQDKLTEMLILNDFLVAKSFFSALPEHSIFSFLRSSLLQILPLQSEPVT
jgi:hypothetical protein